MWPTLQEALPPNIRWIVGGDFNMVENEGDKSCYCSQLISPSKKLIWEATKIRLGIQEKFRAGNGHRFSWDNGRNEGQRILARLDRFYTFIDHPISPILSIESFSVKGDTSLSDHLPIRISLNLGEQTQKKQDGL